MPSEYRPDVCDYLLSFLSCIFCCDTQKRRNLFKL